MKKVLIAVLASSGPPYPDLVKTSQATWDSVAVPGMETVYYFDRGLKEIIPRSLVLNEDGGLYDMGRRDLAAYKALLGRQWDLMVRINASCYVRKHFLMQYAQELPASGYFAGVLAKNTDPEKEFLWGGGNYIMSRDVVQKFVQFTGLWDHRLMEDQSMSKLAKRLGIPLNPSGRVASIDRQTDCWLCICYNGNHGGFTFTDFADLKRLDDQFFFRVKQDGNRQMDMTIMRTMHQLGI